VGVVAAHMPMLRVGRVKFLALEGVGALVGVWVHALVW
jgi:hypothetical protein